MKIISRYILREHVGPFLFALTALTSLMLLNFISRQFGELVGKGLPSSVIAEFFVLSIPFTVALTLPMSVLVAVLYAFSRLASENEVTALKASGVSPWRLVTPAIVWGVFMSAFLLAFNDQVLPRANHRLKTLQDDIGQTKPTFLLKDQVINPISEGKFYLKAGKIDQNNGKMKEVVIYDLADPTRRRTIYADSGAIRWASNRKDLALDLYHGQMQEVSTEKPSQLDRLFFQHDVIQVPNVADGGVKRTIADSASRGDREMGVCEMQSQLRTKEARYQDARRDHDEAVRQSKLTAAQREKGIPSRPKAGGLPPEPHGIGWVYCTMVKRVFGVKAAEAAEPRLAGLHAVGRAQNTPLARAEQDMVKKAAQDTTKKAVQDTAKKTVQDTARKAVSDMAKTVAQDSARKRAADSARRAAVLVPAGAGGEPRVLINGVLIDPRTGRPPVVPAPVTPGVLPQQQPGVPPQVGVILGTSQPPAPGSPGAMPVLQPTDSQRTQAQIAAEAISASTPPPGAADAMIISRSEETKLHLELAKRARNRLEIEIHKKFSLAAACLIFVVLGAPIALRFPRGGVGLVIGVSLVVFALYYVGLIGGEALANKGLVPPFWAMWGTNVILTVVGIVLLFRMGREQNSGRGGDWGDRM
ncbi:MAG: LptF/LptG family permease, partial [Gemmatimonadaceae bacterium]